jgi:hypothetical protein
MTHFSSDYEQGIKDERERILKHLEATKHWRYPNLQVQILFEEMLEFMRQEEEGQDEQRTNE